MLINDPKIQEVLRRIVTRVNRDPVWQEDLMQEAMLHLWRVERRLPGQTTSWYLQGCYFHLLNYMELGKSVDSEKRRQGRASFAEPAQWEAALPVDHFPDTVRGEVMAHDIMAALLRRLPVQAKEILGYLNQGLGAREIARELKVSHKTVNRLRRKIAAQAMLLGLHPSQQKESAAERASSLDGLPVRLSVPARQSLTFTGGAAGVRWGEKKEKRKPARVESRVKV